MQNEISKDYENMFKRLERLNGKYGPPLNWDAFLRETTDVFVAKDTDYDSRFMRGMIELDARTLWAWEVDKKLDRIRTWLKRGELQVKEEGLNNAVSDLFVYTVQYVFYVDTYINGVREAHSIEVWQNNRETAFYKQAYNLKPDEWVEFLEMKGRIKPNEIALKNIIRLYMGDKVTVPEWQQAIRALLEL